MQCIIMENTLIKLTLHDETKKRAHDSQIVRAKENLKLSHGGSSYTKTIIVDTCTYMYCLYTEKRKISMGNITVLPLEKCENH